MSETEQFNKHPDECNHPEEQIEKVAFVNSGIRPRCSVCGFIFMIICSHERVVVHGDNIEDGMLECLNCERTASTAGRLSRKTCNIGL